MASAVHVDGLSEFLAELRAADAKWPRELAKAHRDIGRFVAAEAQSFAAGTGAMQAHFAGSIVGRGNQQGARVGLRGTQANAAFWGAKKHSGWYARSQYNGTTTPQFPAWVGNGWEVGGAGGPHALNPAVRWEQENIMDRLRQAMADVYAAAYPN